MLSYVVREPLGNGFVKDGALDPLRHSQPVWVLIHVRVGQPQARYQVGARRPTDGVVGRDAGQKAALLDQSALPGRGKPNAQRQALLEQVPVAARIGPVTKPGQPRRRFQSRDLSVQRTNRKPFALSPRGPNLDVVDPEPCRTHLAGPVELESY